MQFKSGKNIRVIIIVLSSLVSLLLVFLSITKFMHIQATISSIDENETRYDNNQQRLMQLIKLSQSEGEFRQTIEKMHKLLPEEPEEHSIIHSIESAANVNGSEFLQIEFNDRVVNNNINTMPINLKFGGPYYSLISLMKSITYGERLIIIDGIIISLSEKQDGAINAEIKARAFYK